MMELSSEEKGLLLDYCLGIAPPEKVKDIQGIIASNPQAARLYASFQGVLSPLQSLQSEPCPDDLVEATVARLRQAASQQNLERLLEVEQGRGGPRRIRFPWSRNLEQVAAVAAIALFVAGIAIPSLGFARSIHLRRRCQAQLSQVHNGLSQYVADHDGRLPAVRMADGAPWWKVGYQGTENHSNTRPVWLLVKNGYVRPTQFLCPGARPRPDLGPLTVGDYNDFPAKRYVDYSFRLCCPQARRDPGSHTALMADTNPLSERLPSDFSQPFRIRLDSTLLGSNSINHRRAGQNILRCDGAIEFARTRRVGTSQDDIYSLNTMTNGAELTGCEVPAHETDAFLVP